MDLDIVAPKYHETRKYTEFLCQPLKTEDYGSQPIVDVSPPKWHLGHTTWFFETFILKQYLEGYQEFDPAFGFLFNSYYDTVGGRVARHDRGTLTRPEVAQVNEYRSHVDRSMQKLMGRGNLDKKAVTLIELGINHEQQHQELLLTDLKYILGVNPLFPKYSDKPIEAKVPDQASTEFVEVKGGVVEIGHTGDGFCFDNEQSRHQAYVAPFRIATGLVSCAEYIEFMEDGGYEEFGHWLAEGWDWIGQNNICAPHYWVKQDGKWMQYTLNGLVPVNGEKPVTHVSYYEADAYAAWKGKRLPRESEWEVASGLIEWGHRWEWTQSAYLPYPRFVKPDGAVGEYNGKFMVNQMVLRGASCATPEGHSRPTYRNFFHPHLRWQFTGIRLADDQV